MKRKMIGLIFAILIFATGQFPTLLRAGSLSAKDLNNFCMSEEGSPQALVCLGYFIGFNDAAEWGEKVCAKGAVKEDINLFLRKMKEKPARLQAPASLVVHQILVEAFPCK